MKTAKILAIQLIIVSCVLIKCNHAARFGGLHDVNPNDPELRKVAKIALDEYNDKKRMDLIVYEIIRGQYQVVKGINYMVEFEASHRFISLQVVGIYNCQAEVYMPPYYHGVQRKPAVRSVDCVPRGFPQL